MKLSARNQLKGTIVDVVKGATTSHIRIDIGGGVIVTASITNEAVDDLKLAKGQSRHRRDQGQRRDGRRRLIDRRTLIAGLSAAPDRAALARSRQTVTDCRGACRADSAPR